MLAIGSPTLVSVRTSTTCNALLRELQVLLLSSFSFSFSFIFFLSFCFLGLLLFGKTGAEEEGKGSHLVLCSYYKLALQ